MAVTQRHATIEFMRVKGKATNSYIGKAGLNQGCPEASGQYVRSLNRPWESVGLEEAEAVQPARASTSLSPSGQLAALLSSVLYGLLFCRKPNLKGV